MTVKKPKIKTKRKTKKKRPLWKPSRQQLRFIQQYIVDLNGTQAAIRAGYAKNSAKVQASRLLTNDNLVALIQKAMDKRSQRTEITQDNVLREIALTAFGDVRSLFDEKGNLKRITELDEAAAKAVGSFEVVVKNLGGGEVENIIKVKSNDKLKGLELLGRHLKMFTDRNEISTPPGKPIETKHTITFKGVGPDGN